MKTNLGRVGLVPVGTFSLGTQYRKNDIVSNDKSAYIARVDNKNIPLPNATNETWQLIGRIGADGKGIVVLPNGNFGNWDESTGTYVDTGLPAAATVDVNTSLVTFTQSAIREPIQTGESVSTLFGKVKKWFSDLGTLAFKNSVDYTTEVANAPAIPTKTSQLTNDSTFQTLLQVSDSVTSHNTSSESHQDVRGDISNLENIALTANRVHSGVGVDVTIEQNGDITLSSQIDNNIFIVVTELPITGEENKIYLVPSPTAGDQNNYNEYIFVDGFWEKTGSGGLELDNYYTIQQTNDNFVGKTDRNKHKTVTLNYSSWVISGTLYKYTILDTDIVDGCKILFAPDSSTFDLYIDSLIRPYTTASIGSFDIYCENQPIQDININYTIS